MEWGADAFKRAREEDKPVLLAIGSSWCDGTRRMDAETYADDRVLELIRTFYVPIRVDFELYPDVYDRYNMGGSPSTVFLLPGGEIIAGVTIVPVREMRQILTQVETAYRTQRARIEEEVRTREARIADVRRSTYPPQEAIGTGIFQNTVRGVCATFDPVNGGFGQAPKHPMPASLEVLLQAYAETGGPDFADMLARTLDAMAEKSLFDAVEGGFFRCATTDGWTVPHTAKRLADQAALIRVFAAAAQLLDRPAYRDRVDRTIEYARATLRRGELYAGGQPADAAYYADGGDRRGPKPPVEPVAYVDANAQFASAMLAAAGALDRPDWADEAVRIVEAICREGERPGTGFCHAVEGGARRFVLLRDNVHAAAAMVDAYEWTGRREWLDRAAATIDLCHRRFWHEGERGLKDHDGDPIGVMSLPLKHVGENAVAAQVDARLAVLRAEPARRARAETLLLGFPNYMHEYGHATAELALAADRLVRPGSDVVVAADRPDWRRAALGTYAPRRTVRTAATGPSTVRGAAVADLGELTQRLKG